MPRKPNYNFEKQRKEQNRQAKKDAKREEKLRRKQQEVRRENGIISRHASLHTPGKSHPPLRAVTYLGSGTQQDWMRESR